MIVYGPIRIRYYIGCMYSLICIYGLMNTPYHIFHIYMISHVLTISYVLTYSRYSNLPYDVTQYISNAVYLSLYVLLWNCTTYTASSLWNWSKDPGVTRTWTPLIIYLRRHFICTCLIRVIAIIPNIFESPQKSRSSIWGDFWCANISYL